MSSQRITSKMMEENLEKVNLMLPFRIDDIKRRNREVQHSSSLSDPWQTKHLHSIIRFSRAYVILNYFQADNNLMSETEFLQKFINCLLTFKIIDSHFRSKSLTTPIEKKITLIWKTHKYSQLKFYFNLFRNGGNPHFTSKFIYFPPLYITYCKFIVHFAGNKIVGKALLNFNITYFKDRAYPLCNEVAEEQQEQPATFAAYSDVANSQQNKMKGSIFSMAGYSYA